MSDDKKPNRIVQIAIAVSALIGFVIIAAIVGAAVSLIAGL